MATCAAALMSASAGVVAVVAGAPAAGAQTTASTTTTATTKPPLIPLPTTTTTTKPATSTTTKPGTTSTTAKPGAPASTPATTPGGKVPAVPTAGPPTTTAPAGSPPPAPPDPTPILTQVDSDLAQLDAIDDYKPAQALVASAQAQVTAAGATLQSARQNVANAHDAVANATGAKSDADAKLRSMALAAYIGVGYSTPGFDQPNRSNGDQGAGTVSTPGGLTGVQGLDAKEMLILVGQRARQDVDQAKVSLADAQKAVDHANQAYAKAQADVGAAEASLLAAQQTLKQVTTAATTPGAAAASPLPNLTALGSTPAGATLAAASSPAGPGAVQSPAIIGPSALTGSDLAAWFASTGRQANATVPITQLAHDYQDWGQKTGVRYDLAFAQSVIETGYFSFPAGGQLTAKDNNFAGIGACDTCAHGWSFPDANTGVGAQEELLYEYASPTELPKGLPNVIGANGPGGCCQTWTQLAGVWASSTVYGISIMTVYNQMLNWLIPTREVAAGLMGGPAGATPAAAQGPQLAPLPGGTPPATGVKATSTTKAGQ